MDYSNLDPSDAKFVDVNGVRTRYFEDGNGPHLVLFHGGGISSSAEDWSLVFHQFSQRFHVVAFDQLGLGYTSKPENDFSLPARVKHAISFIEVCGIEGAHLVGHSQGGYVATRVALDSPKMARSLVMEDSGTTAPMGNFGNDGKLSPVVIYSHTPQPTKEWVRGLYEMVVYDKGKITDEYVDQKFRVAMESGNLESTRERGKLSENLEDRKKLDVSERLADLKIPVLVIWGRQDSFAPLFRGMKLLELIPNVDMHIFDKSGHIPMLERTEEFGNLVSSFCLSH